MFIRTFEDAAPRRVARQVRPKQAIDLVTAQRLGRIRTGQDIVKNFGDVVEVLFQFERVVDAIIAPVVELLVIQTRIIFKMHAAACILNMIRVWMTRSSTIGAIIASTTRSNWNKTSTTSPKFLTMS